jgi:two-component system, NarL family, invasion response regulator UvrY
MIKVLVADDHELMRIGLKMLLEGTEDIVVSAEATNGEEVLDKLKADNFDVMVLDISMPKKTGIELLRELKAQGNKIPVLILSTYSMEECGERAIKEGADGFLSKEDAPEKLIDAIRKVSQFK